MARPKRRRQTHSQRKAAALRLPNGAEIAMRLVVVRAVKALRRAVDALPLAQFAKQPEKLDAADGGAPFKAEANQIAKRAGSAMRVASAGLAAKVDRHSKGEFTRLGINLRKAEPKFGPLITKWREENVSRVTGLIETERDNVIEILAKGETKRAEDIASQLAERLEVSERKANLFAREQILSLNAAITRERCSSAGITEYEWVTSNDERVRPSHAALDGQVFSFDDPPETNDDGDRNNPGEDYGGCRCTAKPVIPEFESDAPDTAENVSDRRLRSGDAQLPDRRLHARPREGLRTGRRQGGRADGGTRKLGPPSLQREPGRAQGPRPGQHQEHHRQG